MKKTIILAVLIMVLAMGLVSCGWDIEIRNPNEPEKNISQLLPSENEENKTEEKPEQENSEPEQEEQPKEQKAEPPLSGDYVVLDTSGDTIYEVLEFEDKVVVYYVIGNVAAFDIESGEKLYEYFLGDVNETHAFDMMKTDSRAGFDFSVSMSDRVVYLSSENPQLIDIVFLPENVMYSKTGDVEGYSVFGEKIVWISKEGIRMGNLDGTDEKILIPTEDIENKIKPIGKKAYDDLYFVDDGEPCVFYEVSFICGGEKVVVTSTSDRTFIYWSTALYDVKSGEFEWAYNFNEMVNAEYPFGDKYVAVAKKWINAETGNYKNFGIWVRTANGIDFLRADFENSNEGTGLKLYSGTFETVEEDGKLILEATDKATRVNIEGVTENYVVVCVYGEEKCDAIVRYK